MQQILECHENSYQHYNFSEGLDIKLEHMQILLYRHLQLSIDFHYITHFIHYLPEFFPTASNEYYL